MLGVLLAVNALLAYPALGEDSEVDEQNNEQQETEAPSFDWLVEQGWRDEFKEGLLTLNEEDLKRFVATGNPGGGYRIGTMNVERRTAFSFIVTEGEEPVIDIPASVVIRISNKVVLGAKGLDFGVDIDEEMITISHWNGDLDCSVSKWYFAYDFDSIEYKGSSYNEYISGKKCKRT